MSNQTKKWLMIAAFLVVLGLIMFAIVMTVYGWDFAKLSTVNYETNTYEVSEEFSNISIKSETADIRFEPSGDGTCKVVCYEPADEKYSAAVQDGTLTIKAVNERKWYEYFGIRFAMPKITVYLPESEYAELLIEVSTGDVEIKNDFKFKDIDISTSTGDISVENVHAKSIDLSVSTGKTYITNVRCQNIMSEGSTGDVSLKAVIASEKLSVERSTGDVDLDGCDAAEIFIETSTGDIAGSLLSEKVFFAQTDLGHVDIPKTTSGGKCELYTDTGDIRIDVE